MIMQVPPGSVSIHNGGWILYRSTWIRGEVGEVLPPCNHPKIVG